MALIQVNRPWIANLIGRRYAAGERSPRAFIHLTGSRRAGVELLLLAIRKLRDATAVDAHGTRRDHGWPFLSSFRPGRLTRPSHLDSFDYRGCAELLSKAGLCRGRATLAVRFRRRRTSRESERRGLTAPSEELRAKWKSAASTAFRPRVSACGNSCSIRRFCNSVFPEPRISSRSGPRSTRPA